MYSPKALAQKRKKKIFTVVLVIVVCIVNFAPVAVRGIYKIQYVFDEIYYSGYGEIIKGSYLRWGACVTNCSYEMVKSIEQVNGFSNMYDEYLAEELKKFQRAYKTDALKEGEKIEIAVRLDRKVISYSCGLKSVRLSKEYSEAYLGWGYNYSVEEKTMYINGPILDFSIGEEHFQTTDAEQIASFLQENGYDKTAEEYEHYFLYDKIIHDWTLGNLFRSKYTTWWIGSVKFMDGPPPQKAA